MRLAAASIELGAVSEYEAVEEELGVVVPLVESFWLLSSMSAASWRRVRIRLRRELRSEADIWP